MHKELVNFSCTCHIADALVGVGACTLQIAIWCIIYLMYRSVSSVFRLLCVVVQRLYLEWLTASPDREKWISSLQCIASCYKHSCDCARSINIDQKFPSQIARYMSNWLFDNEHLKITWCNINTIKTYWLIHRNNLSCLESDYNNSNYNITAEELTHKLLNPLISNKGKTLPDAKQSLPHL